jgi:hypothetical protein
MRCSMHRDDANICHTFTAFRRALLGAAPSETCAINTMHGAQWTRARLHQAQSRWSAHSPACVCVVTPPVAPVDALCDEHVLWPPLHLDVMGERAACRCLDIQKRSDRWTRRPKERAL